MNSKKEVTKSPLTFKIRSDLIRITQEEHKNGKTKIFGINTKRKEFDNNTKRILGLKREYKKPPLTFGNTEEIRHNLARNLQEKRHEHRKRNEHRIQLLRNFENSPKRKDSTYSTSSESDHLTNKLLKWKQNRDQKKKQEKLLKKPPFKVGIVHYNAYLPLNTYKFSPKIKNKKKVIESETKSTIKRGITKVTEKRLLAKAEKLAKQKEFVVPIKTKSKNNKENIDKLESPTELSNGFNFVKSPYLFGNVSIENILPCENNMLTCGELMKNTDVQELIHFDLSESVMLKVTSDESSNSSRGKPVNLGEKKKCNAKYFKHLLYKEKKKLKTLCEKWLEIQSQNNIVEDAQYRINQTVGQTTMLINQKFEQFYNLILDYEKCATNYLITETDLQGFWDMMYIEVKDCDSRFTKLEKLQANCWQEEQLSFPKSCAKSNKKRDKKLSSPRALILFDGSQKKIQSTERSHKNLLIDINNDESIDLLSNDTKKTTDIPPKKIDIKPKRFQRNTNGMYTSTPVNNVRSNISLVTMKINKLYNRSTMHIINKSTLYMEETFTKNTREKLESGEKNLKISVNEIIPNNDCVFKKSLNCKSKFTKSSKARPKKVNDFNISKLNSADVSKEDVSIENLSFSQTVVEKTIKFVKSDNTVLTPSDSSQTIKVTHLTPESMSDTLKISGNDGNLSVKELRSRTIFCYDTPRPRKKCNT